MRFLRWFKRWLLKGPPGSRRYLLGRLLFDKGGWGD